MHQKHRQERKLIFLQLLHTTRPCIALSNTRNLQCVLKLNGTCHEILELVVCWLVGKTRFALLPRGVNFLFFVLKIGTFQFWRELLQQCNWLVNYFHTSIKSSSYAIRKVSEVELLLGLGSGCIVTKVWYCQHYYYFKLFFIAFRAWLTNYPGMTFDFLK